MTNKDWLTGIVRLYNILTDSIEHPDKSLSIILHVEKGELSFKLLTNEANVNIDEFGRFEEPKPSDQVYTYSYEERRNGEKTAYCEDCGEPATRPGTALGKYACQRCYDKWPENKKKAAVDVVKKLLEKD